MPTIMRAEYLSYYNPSRNSDKLFNVFLVRNEDGTYSCLTENGRRGSHLVCRTVCAQGRCEQVEQKFWEKVREKRNHRETPYTDEPGGKSFSLIASQYSSDTLPDKVINLNQTTSIERKEEVIAFPVEKINNPTRQQKPGGILNSEQFDSLEI